MRAFVFTDEALAEYAGRFVWLELDMEKAVNAPYRAKPLALAALPTFYVVDPADQSVVLKYVGGMTLPQLTRFLDDGRLALRRKGEPRGDTPADRALARADRAYAVADDSTAAVAYREAIEAAPADWPPYARAAEALQFAASRVGAYEVGVSSARLALPRLGRTPSAGAVVAGGLDCAVSLPESEPRRAEWIRELLVPARDLLADRAVPMAGDDRSGLFITVGGALDALGDTAGVRANNQAWSAFLDGEAAKATTPAARMVFDPHRLSAYLELGRPELALPMLEQSERDAPADYNPPARLAIAYQAMKRWDEGLAASDRALAKVYGPRKLTLYNVRVQLYTGKGDTAAARRTLEDALAYAKSLPAGQRSAATIAGLEKRLAAMAP